MKYKFKPSHIVPAFLFVVAVLYGGSKPPCPTNTPPNDAVAPTDGAPQNANQRESNESPRMLVNRFASIRPIGEDSRSASISNWTARGAYCDWQPITFRDGFRFPVGTNFIDGVTLFAWGELRLLTANSQQLTALPSRVSLEPNASSVTHGLTPSNSYLFAWHNVCAERSATNRVDASIELFRSGAIATTVTPLSAPTPPTYTYQPAVPPAGFVGNGQDEEWIRANFPADADAILAKGYEDWLLNDYVGINEQNGHYLVRVTIDPSAFNQSPIPSSQSPIYLVCGPYRVNVTVPGTYGFPLEVFTWYAARTYPERVTLSYSFDDGFRDGDESFEIEGNITPRPRLLLAAPPALDADNFKMNPKVVATPNHIPLNRVAQTPVSLWCNLTNRVSYFISRGLYQANVIIHGSTVDIREAEEPIRLEVIAENAQEAARGYIYIDEPIRNDGIVFVGSNVCERIITNNLAVTHVTAASHSGATNMFFTVHDVSLPPNVSAYVAVYMATGEHVYDEHDCCDDIVSWRVSSNAGDFSGSTSVFAEKNRIGGASSLVNRLYGVLFDPFLLTGRRFAPPEGGSLHFDLEAAAGNVTDGYSQTCVQIVVYPVDENGNPLDFPSWAHQ